VAEPIGRRKGRATLGHGHIQVAARHRQGSHQRLSGSLDLWCGGFLPPNVATGEENELVHGQSSSVLVPAGIPNRRIALPLVRTSDFRGARAIIAAVRSASWVSSSGSTTAETRPIESAV